MPTRVLPIEEVLSRTGLSRRTLYNEISEGRFPKPVQLTTRRVGWPGTEVETYQQDRCPRRDGRLTGLTPPEHEHSAAIDEAAAWLSTTPERQRPHPLLPHRQKAFGLTVAEAIAAIREANLRRARAA